MIVWYVLCSWWPHLRVTKFFFSLTSVSFIIEARLADRGWRWDLERLKRSASSQIYYEILPSFFGDERPASHELSRCSWIGAAEPVAWLRSKPPIMSKLQKLSRAELSRAPATLIRQAPWPVTALPKFWFRQDAKMAVTACFFRHIGKIFVGYTSRLYSWVDFI